MLALDVTYGPDEISISLESYPTKVATQTEFAHAIDPTHAPTLAPALD